jgi:N-acyl amino acid synthase of PEP-CTERM/exosortase system
MKRTLEAASELRPPALADDLDQHFALYRADTPELQEICHRLRFEVYCVDNPFESAAESRDGLELDALDRAAAHALVVHRGLNIAVGTVRLILPARLDASAELPFQKICGYRDPISLGQVPLHAAAEISRFGMPRRVRQLLRSVAGLSLDAERHMRADEELGGGLPILMLIRGFLMLAADHGVSHLGALMEPALLRRVARLGIFFDPVGPPVEYHGLRQPSFVAIADMLGRVDSLRPDVWQAITAHGRLAYPAAPRLAAE